MNAKGFWYGLVALGLAFALTLLCVPAFADTLTLKDGRVIRGRYIGGTADTIEMDVNGQVQTFDMANVQSLSRDPAPPKAAPPSSLPDAPPPSPRADAVAPPAANPDQGKITVPVGTRILVRMIDGVDSEQNRVGDRFRASLETNIEQEGAILARRGTEVYGRLSNVQGAGRLTGHAELKLELTGMLVHNSLVPMVTGDYEAAGKGRGGNTAKKTAGGAVLGAIIGALAGGGKGAAIGAGAGAATGATINIITKGEKVKVPSETLLEFRLDAPLTMTPEYPAPR
jgi:YMGG-like Gly-zipper